MFGDWTSLSIFLYVLGLFLLMIEGAIPGFGLPGITGIICVTISIALITSSLYEALLLIIVTTLLFVSAIVLLYKLGYVSKYLKFLVLNTEQNKEEGYISQGLDSSYVGRTGVAETILRPAGIVKIDNKRISAQSQGDFIENGAEIIVTEVADMKIIVKKLEKED